MKKPIASIVAGLILGVVGSRYLFVGSWLNLIPWTIAGFAIGYWGTRNESIVNGVVFGFILSFVFMLAGYNGRVSLISRVPFFAVLGVFGGVCGMVLGLLGFHVKTKVIKRTNSGG